MARDNEFIKIRDEFCAELTRRKFDFRLSNVLPSI